VRTWKEHIGNMKKSKNSTSTPTLPKRQNPGSFECMLYCLIARAKFLFLHLFVTIFRQLGGLFMLLFISMGDSRVCFVFVVFFSEGAMLNFPLVPPCYNLHTLKLKRSQTIWDKNWGVIRNTEGTIWEHGGNIQRTKASPPPDPQNPKGKKLSSFSFLIGCMKFLFSKLFATIFSLG
jgi:hypothetical protein